MKTTSKLSMTLLPRFPGLKLENVAIATESISLSVASTQPEADCPICGSGSGRLHSHYERTVSDLPWAGRAVRISLRVRRFRCANRGCPRRIFAERLPSVVKPYARKTVRLREILLLVGFALGGEAGARLLVRLGLRASPSTLLRSLHGAALPSFDPPEVIGVDDFAFLKGRKYGTIVVDFERHRPEPRHESVTHISTCSGGKRVTTRCADSKLFTAFRPPCPSFRHHPDDYRGRRLCQAPCLISPRQ